MNNKDYFHETLGIIYNFSKPIRKGANKMEENLKDEYDISWEKERYYVLYDKKNKPRITICLIKDKNGHIARGTAVRSLTEDFDMKRGMDWAYGYAVDAFIENSNTNPINRERCKFVLSLVGLENYKFHSEFNPELSFSEKAFLDDRYFITVS